MVTIPPERERVNQELEIYYHWYSYKDENESVVDQLYFLGGPAPPSI